jgi:branched-chain amino acid transport system permease protein
VELTAWSGIVNGAIFALVACGFTLSMLPSGIFNFAQGAVVVAGCYLAYEWFKVIHVPLAWAIVLNLVIGVLLGLACELLTVRPLRRYRSGRAGSELITTVGMATAILGAVGLRWGYLPLLVPGVGSQGVVSFWGIRTQPIDIAIVIAALIISVSAYCWFRLTRLGQSCLAIAENQEAASLRGINVSRFSLVAFAAAGALGTVTGLLIGPVTFALPSLSTTLSLGAFVSIALGGEGNFLGLLWGGLLVGIVPAIAVRYIGANYDNLSVLALLVIVLVVRPGGLGQLRSVRHV